MCQLNMKNTEMIYTIWKNTGAFPCCSEMISTRFKYNITKLLDFIKKQKMNEYEVSHLYQAKVQLLLSSLQSSQKEKIWVTSCHARVCTQKTKLGSICHWISKVVYLNLKQNLWIGILNLFTKKSHFSAMIVMQVFLKKDIWIGILN